jgi:hypothetical protein
MIDEFSQKKIDGMHLIQIELKRIKDIKFPYEISLNSVGWWYYMMKFTDQFTEKEIQRCKDFWMLEEVKVALFNLKFENLDSSDKEKYQKEVMEV